MANLDVLIDEAYKKFVGLPANGKIVRENIKSDAFSIVVLETLYGKEKNIDVSKMTATDIGQLTKYIVVPPDNGIDIVVEHEEIDDYYYDFIQVKDSALSQLDISQAMLYMKKAVKDYIKNPESVNENLRKVLSTTNLSNENKSNCKYYVVHRGSVSCFKNQSEKNEIVVTGTNLECIRDAIKNEEPTVPFEQLESDSFNNFIEYNGTEDESAIMLNLRGLDLARLANKYTQTILGRSILYGQNLRDPLGESSDTYQGMKNTIENEPERFWFYNNGITIITEDFNVKKLSDEKVDKIILKNFSIINGAQTTSALGLYLSKAELNSKVGVAEDLLKRVFVLARILKVNDKDFQDNIARYNNTQNPINSRDMASKRPEQRHLHDWLIEGEEPHIYVDYRRGTTVPDDVRILAHQRVSNDTLAQFAYAGFKLDPGTAKNNKKALFEIDYNQSSYFLNRTYHEIFHYDGENNQGVLFQKTKDEIDELLFIHYIYNSSKSKQSKYYNSLIKEQRENLNHTTDSAEIERIQETISQFEKANAVCNKCVFFCLTYYYFFKQQFKAYDSNTKYKYNEFYSSDKKYKEELIDSFIELFLTGTIELIIELASSSSSIDNWIRKGNTDAFRDGITKKLMYKVQLGNKFKEYVQKFKTID